MPFTPKFASMGASGGAATWGGITGTIVDQTDLQSALSAKASLASANAFTAAGAASTSAISLTGAPYKLGTTTTNHPLFYFNQAGATAPTNWSAKGTSLGMSLPAADSYPNHGDAIRVLVDNTPVFSVDKSGGVYAASALIIGSSASSRSHGISNQTSSRMNLIAADTHIAAATSSGFFCASTTYFGWSNGTSYAGTVDTFLKRGSAAATVQMGEDAAGVTHQHFKACSRITSDGVGANLTLSGGNGRGGAGGDLILASYTTEASATGGTLTTRWKLDAATGALLPGANATYNLGSAAAVLASVYSTDYYSGSTKVVGGQQAGFAAVSGSPTSGIDTIDLSGLTTIISNIQTAINTCRDALNAHGLTTTV